MTLHDKIISLYPEIKQHDFITVIRLQNNADGTDDYIAKWEHPDYPCPTDEQLNNIA